MKETDYERGFESGQLYGGAGKNVGIFYGFIAGMFFGGIVSLLVTFLR